MESANGPDDRQRSRKGLVSLVQSSVENFFGLLYAKVDQSLEASPAAPSPRSGGSGATIDGEEQQKLGSQQAPQGGGDGAAGTGELELDPVALGGVVAAVQQLVTDIETVDPHVPQVWCCEREEKGSGGGHATGWDVLGGWRAADKKKAGEE